MPIIFDTDSRDIKLGDGTPLSMEEAISFIRNGASIEGLEASYISDLSIITDEEGASYDMDISSGGEVIWSLEGRGEVLTPLEIMLLLDISLDDNGGAWVALIVGASSGTINMESYGGMSSLNIINRCPKSPVIHLSSSISKLRTWGSPYPVSVSFDGEASLSGWGTVGAGEIASIPPEGEVAIS